jgi:hypothetical protein
MEWGVDARGWGWRGGTERAIDYQNTIPVITGTLQTLLHLLNSHHMRVDFQRLPNTIIKRTKR